MTLQSSGPIGLADIADEFALARSTPFPSGFYGKGGASASGPLSFADFYGRSAVAPLSASAAPSSVFGTGRFSTVVTPSCTVTASGGSGNYAYSWAKTSGDNITVSSPSSASTSFAGTAMGPGEDRSATFVCTVTDTSNGTTATTSTVAAEVSNVGNNQ